MEQQCKGLTNQIYNVYDFMIFLIFYLQLNLYVTGNTKDDDVTWFTFLIVHVKYDGTINMITDPVNEAGINLKVCTMSVCYTKVT